MLRKRRWSIAQNIWNYATQRCEPRILAAAQHPLRHEGVHRHRSPWRCHSWRSRIQSPGRCRHTISTRIYEAARQEEGALQVFWGGDAGSQGDGVRKAFGEAYPDAKLNLTVDLSKYHDNRIDRAHLEGIHVADVAVLQTSHDFRRWKSEGKLLHYKPATFDDIINGEKDADGAWHAQAVYGFGDLPDKKFKSKLILTYPKDDDAIAYLFSLIVGRYGFQWLYDLAQNDVQWVRGTATGGLLLVDYHNNTSSTRALSFTTSGPNFDYISTKVPEAPEQYLSWGQTGAIIASTPRPESAKLFMSWLTSAERQNATAAGGSPSVLTSFNELYGVSPNSNATQISDFRVFEENRNTVEWWKNLFEEVLGTPQGKGPLEVYPNSS